MPEFIDPAYNKRSIEDIKESCGIDDINTIKALAERNYGFFLEHVLGLNTDSELIQEAIDVVNNPPEQPGNKATKIAVMAPRGHSKTYSWTVGRALYVAYTQTNKRIILTSASRSQSKGILEKAKRIIERNEMLQFLKPSPANREMLAEQMDMKDDEGAWAKKSVVLTTDVTIKTKTFGSSIRSEHVDYVFCDDILSDGNSGSKSNQQEKDLFYEVVSPIVENKGGTLQVVGTPQSHNDLLQELLDKPNYYGAEYQAYDPETEEVLWPWNWTYKGLMQKKEEIGPAKFAREYMCDPMSVEEQFFGYEDCIEPNLDVKHDEQHWKPNTNRDEYGDWQFFLGVDIALSNSSDADYTVATVLGVDPSDTAWLVDIHREKGMTPPQIASMIKRLDQQYAFGNGLVEKNAIGEGVWDTISREAQLSGRIKSFDTTRKTRPQMLSRLQASLYRNELILHKHDELIDEMMAFHKKEGGKLEGKAHDDIVMSLAIALRASNLGKATASVTIIDESGGEVEVDEDDMEEGIEDVKIEDDLSGEIGIV